MRILDTIKNLKLEKKTKYYQASTSELFGENTQIPQNEKTKFMPCSPYAVAKQYAYNITKLYRDAYGIFAVNGILFNHESERRGEEFVTRKITLAAARISEGLQECLELGNLYTLRDWGYAKDYVESMWLMLQQEKPSDYVIATGEQHTVKDFVEKAFKYNNINIEWRGRDFDEVGINKTTGKTVVKINSKYYRPLEVTTLLGDSRKAQKELKWNPKKTSYEEMIKIMCESDKKIAKKEKLVNELNKNQEV